MLMYLSLFICLPVCSYLWRLVDIHQINKAAWLTLLGRVFVKNDDFYFYWLIMIILMIMYVLHTEGV